MEKTMGTTTAEISQTEYRHILRVGAREIARIVDSAIKDSIPVEIVCRGKEEVERAQKKYGPEAANGKVSIIVDVDWKPVAGKISVRFHHLVGE